MPPWIDGQRKKGMANSYRKCLETADKVKTWEWTWKGDLKVETEAVIFAAQEQALRTNFNINKLVELSPCRLCGQKSETNHIISGYKHLAQSEYKRKHNNYWNNCNCK